jgi:hypothetical protein
VKRISFVLLSSFLFFSTFWSCCLPNSVNPLSAPKNADYEDRLEGTWYGKSETNTDVFLHIGKRKDNGTTQVISVEHKNNGSLDLVKMELIMFPTIINDEYFMNIKVVEISDKSIPPDIEYIFVKYEISPENLLTFSFVNHEKIKEAINSGTLKGSIPQERKIAVSKGNTTNIVASTGCTIITDSTQNIVRYFKSMLCTKESSKEVVISSSPALGVKALHLLCTSG